MSDEAKRLYSMKLHENISVSYLDIFRVAGGWLYFIDEGAAFVPFSDEFLPDAMRVTIKPKEK